MIAVGKLEVHNLISSGLFGLALDPNFTKNQRIYLQYTPLEDTTIQYVSRFQLEGGKLNHDSEQRLLEIPVEYYNHLGGGLAFDSKGNLFIATGDNSRGNHPVDEKKGRRLFDAQRTAANTNSLRGKILRIHPHDDGTYSIPTGNLFAEGDPDSRPEIYIMGCRNPFRLFFDKKTNYLYWGDVGPNASEDSEKGPMGYEEVNLANKPGNFGWPQFNADNKPIARVDFTTGEPVGLFDHQHPVNTSPNNTGRRMLPPAQPAIIWYPGKQSEQWPFLGKGSRSIKAGPVYHYDEHEYFSQTRLPEHYDNVLFIYDWSRNWIMAARLDGPGNFKSIEPFMPNAEFASPIDMQFGMDGSLYVLEYGKNFYNNPNGKLVRIEYVKGINADKNKADSAIKSDSFANDANEKLVGEQLINDNDCNNCHLLNEKSFGPSYMAITDRYKKQSSSTIEQLTQKVINGGSGNWGEVAMTPHPYLTEEEISLMLEYIFSVHHADED
jgi:cytochrome c